MYVCVLDLGSLYCRALCLGWNGERYQLLGLVEIPSGGVMQGEVVNTEKAAATLTRALELLEQELLKQQIQVPIREISLVYSGVTLGCHNSWGITGTTPLRSHSDPRDSSARCVTEADIERALNSAAELRISADLERLHEIPRCYKLDGKVLRRDILGSNGIRLEIEVHIITCLREAIENLIEISSRGEQHPVEIVHSSIAASYISLTDEELEQGCLLLDMGYSATSFQYSFEGQPLITESVGLGGYHSSHDIAEIFGTSFEVAEQLKLQHGICWPAFVTPEERVIIPGGATSMAQEISRLELCEVLNARVEEIFEIVYGRLEYYGIQREYIQSTVLIGGSALLSGMSELAEEVFASPARLGLPDDPALYVNPSLSQVPDWMSPQYTALFGLALYWLDEERQPENSLGISQPWERGGRREQGTETGRRRGSAVTSESPVEGVRRSIPRNMGTSMLNWIKRKLM